MFALSRALIQGKPLCMRGALIGNHLRHATQERSQVRIKVVAPDAQQEALSQLGYEQRNERIGRMLSPHLTIYAPQLTSMLSISQRISGMALTVYAWSLGIGFLMSPYEMQHYITMLDGLDLNENCFTAAKFILSLPVTFHYLNSLRHLLWTFGSLLKLNLVYSTGYTVMALTPLTAAGLSLM